MVTRSAVLLVLASLAVLALGRFDDIERRHRRHWKRPKFCGDMDCPKFKVEDETDNYEIRTYQRSKWATTWVNDTKYELAYAKGTQRLMGYFKGGNEEEETIDITTPTLVAVHAQQEDGNLSLNKSFGFSYWLPKEFQRKTPRPTDGEVEVVEYDEVTVYVRVFSGFATEGSIVKEAEALHETLKDDERDFEESELFVAIYDKPQKLLKRHNEIHVPVAGKKYKPVSKA